jgi:hypothetical protein
VAKRGPTLEIPSLGNSFLLDTSTLCIFPTTSALHIGICRAVFRRIWVGELFRL